LAQDLWFRISGGFAIAGAMQRSWNNDGIKAKKNATEANDRNHDSVKWVANFTHSTNQHQTNLA
jgi:hypothetical protein